MIGVGHGLPQCRQVEHTELDEVGTQAAAVDELGLQSLIELRLRDEALADQMRSELFGHAGADSSPVRDTKRTAPSNRA